MIELLETAGSPILQFLYLSSIPAARAGNLSPIKSLHVPVALHCTCTWARALDATDHATLASARTLWRTKHYGLSQGSPLGQSPTGLPKGNPLGQSLILFSLHSDHELYWLILLCGFIPIQLPTAFCIKTVILREQRTFPKTGYSLDFLNVVAYPTQDWPSYYTSNIQLTRAFCISIIQDVYTA